MFYWMCTLLGLSGVGMWAGVSATVTWPAAALIWGAGVLLLAYGLLRDLYLLRQCRCEQAREEGVKSSMICVESLVGMTVVAQGLLLHWLGWTPYLKTPIGLVMVGAAAVLAFGHLTRDWVLLLVSIPNHRNILPTWRVQTLDEVSQLGMSLPPGAGPA